MEPESPHRGSDVRGPVLYVESETLGSEETFCTQVFDDDRRGEYRVVQLTSVRSFDSLRESLAAQLRRIDDPSEAAVIIATPETPEEATATRVGEEVPLYGFWVEPDDLTGISIAFSRLVERWEGTEGSMKICLRDVESLLPYHDPELLYRFLNTVLATLQGAGASVHAHLTPDAMDPRTFRMFRSLFTRVVDADGTELDGSSDVDGAGGGPPASPASGSGEDPVDADLADRVSPTRMTDDEIDSFLQSEGYGVLAFAGEPPYAVPISYGFDPANQLLYVQLSRYDGSEKRARLTESSEVSLVVTRYRRPDKWRSVVVDGTVERLTAEEARRRNVFEAYADSSLASVDVFTRDPAEVAFDWYVLDPADTSGRRSVGSLDGDDG